MPHQQLNSTRMCDDSHSRSRSIPWLGVGDRASTSSVLDVFSGAILTFQASRMSVSSQRFRCPREIQVPVLPRSGLSPPSSACRGRRYQTPSTSCRGRTRHPAYSACHDCQYHPASFTCRGRKYHSAESACRGRHCGTRGSGCPGLACASRR